MLTLYQAEWCPYCHRVRQVLTELELTYTNVNVPLARADRTKVRELSGQEVVPVLKDGRKVITGSDEIIAHLRATYPSPPDAADHAEVGRFRVVLELDEGPADIRIISEIRGDELGTHRLPDGYVLLQAAAVWAVERAAAIDPTAPAAATFPVAVFAVDGGSAIAVTRPFAEAWLYGDLELSKTTMALTQRVYEALGKL
jgi:glutathione S-transferase